MSEIPKEVKDFLEMIRTDEILDLAIQINRKTSFLSQIGELKLYTINTDKNKLILTFELRFSDISRFEEKMKHHLGGLIDKPALLVF